MELLQPQGAHVLVSYEHPAWKEYAAVTEHSYGKGSAVYVGCKTTDAFLSRILRYCAEKAGISLEENTYPVIVRKGTNPMGEKICYYLNYSPEVQQVRSHPSGDSLMDGKQRKENEGFELNLWVWRLRLQINVCRNVRKESFRQLNGLHSIDKKRFVMEQMGNYRAARYGRLKCCVWERWVRECCVLGLFKGESKRRIQIIFP